MVSVTIYFKLVPAHVLVLVLVLLFLFSYCFFLALGFDFDSDGCVALDQSTSTLSQSGAPSATEQFTAPAASPSGLLRWPCGSGR